MFCFLSVYAAQCGLSDYVNDLSYDHLCSMTEMNPAFKFLVQYDNWKGHVGSAGSGNKEVFFNFSLTVKAAPHECVIRTGQPKT